MYYYNVDGMICASFAPRDFLPASAEEAHSVRVFLFARPLEASRACFAVSDEALLYQETENAGWLSARALGDAARHVHARLGEVNEGVRRAIKEARISAVNINHPRWRELLRETVPLAAGKKRVHIVALGDVGSHILIGLRLLGGDCIASIGIYDLNPAVCARWEFEANQIMPAFAADALPSVEVIGQDALFDCDVFVFAASAGVPPLSETTRDVRMAQLEKNVRIIKHYAKMAREANFRGLFCEVSDPVDPLAEAAWRESNTNEDGIFDGLGLLPEQVQGFGLGVMNARAAYYAKKNPRFARFLEEGRVFGGHGKELVVADAIQHYDDALSRELTGLALEANLRMRELGFKPYVAPAYSSGVLSILETLRAHWHYGSVFLGGIYMGVKNRYTENGQEHEILDLPEALLARIRESETSLHAINKMMKEDDDQ